jgi:hypothetical protein
MLTLNWRTILSCQVYSIVGPSVSQWGAEAHTPIIQLERLDINHGGDTRSSDL